MRNLRRPFSKGPKHLHRTPRVRGQSICIEEERVIAKRGCSIELRRGDCCLTAATAQATLLVPAGLAIPSRSRDASLLWRVSLPYNCCTLGEVNGSSCDDVQNPSTKASKLSKMDACRAGNCSAAEKHCSSGQTGKAVAEAS